MNLVFFDLSVIVFRGQTKLALIVLCMCFRFLDRCVFFDWFLYAVLIAYIVLFYI